MPRTARVPERSASLFWTAFPRPAGPHSAWSESQSWILQPRLAKRPGHPDTGSERSSRLRDSKCLRRRQRQSRPAGRSGLASGRTIYEYHSHRQISNGTPKVAWRHNMVIILALNRTVNVTCWLSTLPFRGSLNAPVPKKYSDDADHSHHRSSI